MLPPYLWQRIKAVLFDAEGTLFHIYPSVGHVYAQVARAHGLKVEAEEVEARFQEVFRAKRLKDRLSPEDCYQNWREIFCQTLEYFGPLPDKDKAFEACYKMFSQKETFVLSPGTKELISSLRASGRKIGILSNWDDRLHVLLEEFGLAKAFDLVLTSCEAGLAKPDPRFFEQACEELGVYPEEALMVGDHLEEDVLAARRAGLWALRYPGGELTRLFPL